MLIDWLGQHAPQVHYADSLLIVLVVPFIQQAAEVLRLQWGQLDLLRSHLPVRIAGCNYRTARIVGPQVLCELLPGAAASAEDQPFLALCSPRLLCAAGDRKSTRLNSSHVSISY